MVRLLKAAFGSRKPANPERFRRLRPKRAESVVETEQKDGILLLEMPFVRKPPPKWWPLRPMKTPKVRSFELEELGRFVWSRCDGRQNAEAIAKALTARYKMPRIEAEAALSAFLQTLAQRGLIVFEEKTKK